MSENPLVSIVMGIYNCEYTLCAAVNCIVEQTYKNWELIICDDASTDNTYAVAFELAKKDPRITLICNEKNLTLAPTLNRCISLAKGEYIARMDGDDLCAIDRLEKEITFLEQNKKCAFVSCQMELFDDCGNYRTISHKEKPCGQDLIFRSQFCHAGCVMRKGMITELGGYSTEKKNERIEDYDLWVRAYASGYYGFNIQETLYYTRDDRNALRRRSLQNRINEARLKYRICREFKLPILRYILIIVPIIKWIMPLHLYTIFHKRKDTR